MIQEYWVKSPVSEPLLLLWRKVNLRWAFVLFLMGHYLNLLLQLSVNINTKHSNHWCKCCYETTKNTFCNSNMTLKIDHPNTLDNILEETDIVHIGSASLTRSVKQTNKQKRMMELLNQNLEFPINFLLHLQVHPVKTCDTFLSVIKMWNTPSSTAFDTVCTLWFEECGAKLQLQ